MQKISLLFSLISLSIFAIKIDKHLIQTYKGDYIIYIKKSEFKMYILNRNLNKIEEFRVGLGLNKGQKIMAGDNKTPEGVYYITEILSMDAPKQSKAYKKLKRMNSVYFRAKDGYHKFGKPTEDLGKNAYGLRFFRISYPNKRDIERFNRLKRKGLLPKNAKIGFGIAIHGTCDNASIGHRSSSGCIRLNNKDIVKLDKYIKIGTMVYIER